MIPYELHNGQPNGTALDGILSAVARHNLTYEIRRDGKPVAVILSVEEYEALRAATMTEAR